MNEPLFREWNIDHAEKADLPRQKRINQDDLRTSAVSALTHLSLDCGEGIRKYRRESSEKVAQRCV